MIYKKVNETNKGKKNYLALEIMLIIIIVCLIINPQKYSISTLNGIIVWATILLPSLFPFIFFTKIFSTLKITDTLSKVMKKPMQALYNVPGCSSFIFVISILSGYPVGSKVASDFFANKQLSQNELKRTITFTSNSGPMFIIGSVGCGMFLSKPAGIIIYVSHILGSLINGLYYRRKQKDEVDFDKSQSNVCGHTELDLSKTISSSIASILAIGAYVCLFFTICEILISIKIFLPFEITLNKLFNIDFAVTNGFLSGLFEITKGCRDLSLCGLSLKTLTVLGTFLISFGGLATFFQAYNFLQPCKITKKFFIKQKITHATTACIISFFLSLIFL